MKLVKLLLGSIGRGLALINNGIEPEGYLRHVIAHIGAHPVNRLHELLPWTIAARATQSVAA